MNNQSAKILIVGAGPAGLTLACELLRRGVPCRIIDKNQSPSLLSKALGVSSTSLLIFQRMGIAEKIIDNGLKIQDMEFFWQQRRFLHINYRYLKDMQYPYILNIHQPETEKYLHELLQSLGGKIERGVELQYLTQDENKVCVKLCHNNGLIEQVEFEEVVGCDGSRSAVRSLLDIPFEGEDYDLHFIYTDVNIEWQNQQDKVFYYADQGSLLIIIPTPNNVYRVVGLVPGKKSERPQPTLQDMQNYVDQFAPGKIILKNATQLGSVPLYYRLAKKNCLGRVYLAGDAAHLFSPLGGQGMNVGIQDAYNLAWKLAYVKKGMAKPILLESYQTERHALVEKLIADIDNMINMLLQQDKSNNELIKNIAPTFSNRTFIKKHLPKKFSGYHYTYEKNAVLKDNLIDNDRDGNDQKDFPKAGEYIDDFTFLSEQHEHTLLIFLNKLYLNKPKYSKKIQHCLNSYSFIQVRYRENSYFNDRICLVRPDGYISYQGHLHDVAGLKNYLNHLFGGGVYHA